MTGTQIITGALRDLSELRTGQATSTDILNDCLTELNNMVDEWIMERFFIYKGDTKGDPGVILSSFDLTTDHALKPGYAECLRKNLAVRIVPMMKLHLKHDRTGDTKPILDPIIQRANETKRMLGGVGPA